jgi:uncharacterized protein
MPTAAAPAATRIASIDVLRGFALLGILVMNIAAFSMPLMAYLNPLAYGGDGFVDRAVHGLAHVFFDQKFMALFSMLFGAGVILLTERLTETGRSAVLIHYVRNLWLFVFGLAHATLLWEGDVLLVYAVCGFALYPIRRWKPAVLLTLAGLILAGVMALHLTAALSVQAAGLEAELDSFFNPSTAQLESEVELFSEGSYSDQVTYRWEGEIAGGEGAGVFLGVNTIDAFSRALAMMLVGMALYRSGVLRGAADDRTYTRMIRWGFGLGIPLAALSLWVRYAADWDATFVLGAGAIPNLAATVAMSLGYAGLIMRWCRATSGSGLQGRLAAVGQTALSNYIFQSVAATLVFYSYGLGWFGSVSRPGQMAVVVVIWTIQLIASPWWIARFRFGPLEWLWRTLTYLRPQPIRR